MYSSSLEIPESNMVSERKTRSGDRDKEKARRESSLGNRLLQFVYNSFRADLEWWWDVLVEEVMSGSRPIEESGVKPVWEELVNGIADDQQLEQHQSSVEWDNLLYSALDMPIQLAWNQREQISHSIPFCVDLTDLLQTPHGKRHDVGPGLLSIFPLKSK